MSFTSTKTLSTCLSCCNATKALIIKLSTGIKISLPSSMDVICRLMSISPSKANKEKLTAFLWEVNLWLFLNPRAYRWQTHKVVSQNSKRESNVESIVLVHCVLSISRRGRKITALGVLFDFTGNAANTTVQKVADMVKEQWVSIIVGYVTSYILQIWTVVSWSYQGSTRLVPTCWVRRSPELPECISYIPLHR